MYIETTGHVYKLQNGKYGINGVCKKNCESELSPIVLVRDNFDKYCVDSAFGDVRKQMKDAYCKKVCSDFFKNPETRKNPEARKVFAKVMNPCRHLLKNASWQSLDKGCKNFAKLYNLDDKYLPAIMLQLATIKQIQKAAIQGSKIAQVAMCDYYTKTLTRESAQDCKLKDTIDASFCTTKKSAKESAKVFIDEYKKLLKEAKLRNVAPNLALRNSIDKSFKISKKSAELSAKVFQDEYKQALEEAKLRNAEPDLTLRNAIDDSFKTSGKSAQMSAMAFLDNDKDLNKPNEEIKLTETNKKANYLNRKVFAAIAAATGILLYVLLPDKKQQEKHNATSDAQIYPAETAYPTTPLYPVVPMHKTESKNISYTIETGYSAESSYSRQTSYSTESGCTKLTGYSRKSVHTIQPHHPTCSAEPVDFTDFDKAMDAFDDIDFGSANVKEPKYIFIQFNN